MDKITIIYPAIAMFVFTIGMIFTLGISRFIAVQKRKVSLRYFQQYTDGQQPEKLHILSRHVQNHFEVPPLFYAGVLFLYVTNSVGVVSITAAWLFVILRCIHSYIHLGSNNVKHRFYCFLLSLLALIALWGSLFVSVVAKS